MGRAALVDDEPDRVRPAAATRQRADRDTLPEDFSTQYPARGVEAAGNNLRSRRRAPVRKGVLPAWTKSRVGRIILLCTLILILVALAAAAFAVRSFFEHDPRFRIETSDSIQTTGNSQLTRDQLLSVFGADIGRNIFFVPLTIRRKQLEQVPWVAHATVMRLLPDQLRVSIVERKPIAFARVGNEIKLVDADGVILDMQPAELAAKHYSFPVVTGINPQDPLSVRRPRMAIYQKFMNEIDSSGEKLSKNLSEIDISDPEDVQGLVSAGGSDILLHFGEDNFLNRWHEYQAHLAEWKQQYPRLASVDLRYDRQVVLKMADAAPSAQDTSSVSATTPRQPAAQARPTTHPHRKRA